jgi:hypothetical protein
MQRQVVATATLAGTVRLPAGASVGDLRLWMRPASAGAAESTQIRMTGDSRFVATGVIPGSYVVGGEASLRPQTGLFISMATPVRPLWARLPVVVAGIDLEGLELRLQPAMEVTGRVEFQAAQAGPPALTRPIRLL